MKGISKFIAATIVCSIALLGFSCENDINDLGSNLFQGASSNVYYLNVTSYNTNNDSLRSDERVLQSGILGVYDEPVFGKIKASFYSQARLGKLNPTFGEEPEMDSVLLSIPVFVKNKTEDVKIDTTYIYLAEGETPSDTATIKLKRTYKLDSIYGNTSTPITLQIKEVSKYMQSQDSILYSNPTIPNCQGCTNINKIEVFPQILGSAQVEDSISTYQIIKYNDPETPAPAIAVRIKLDKTYFKQKFIDNEGSSNLTDQASFIRNFFRGIEISTPEEQGFLMNFMPSSDSFNIIMYYSFKNPAEDPGDGTYKPRKNGTLPLLFTSYWSTNPGYNSQVNQFEHTNRSSQFVEAYTHPNTLEGDKRIYLSGMDGTKTIIKLNSDELNEIKQNVENNGWAIVGAELNLYVDDSYSLKKPPYLFAWNNYTKDEKVKNVNFEDVSRFFNFYPSSVQFNPMYNYKSDPKMYTIRITDYIKSMVERGEVYDNNSIVLSLGNFLLLPATGYTEVIDPKNPFSNNRAFNPYRIVLHGSNSEQLDKRMKLKIYYTKK